jgi:hypothetical protein
MKVPADVDVHLSEFAASPRRVCHPPYPQDDR